MYTYVFDWNGNDGPVYSVYRPTGAFLCFSIGELLTKDLVNILNRK